MTAPTREPSEPMEDERRVALRVISDEKHRALADEDFQRAADLRGAEFWIEQMVYGAACICGVAGARRTARENCAVHGHPTTDSRKRRYNDAR